MLRIRRQPCVASPRILLIGLLLLPLLLTGQSKEKAVRLEDHSDRWSVLNESFKSPKSKRLDIDLSPENFEVMGLSLDYDRSFQSVQNKFGQADIVERGDASTGRDQVCYLSEQHPEIHLIFEQGELNLVFYMIAGGEHWNGEAFCVKSRVVTAGVSTTSGLHLGMTRDDLEQVLGKPDLSANERLVYFRELKKKKSPTELAKLRTEHSELSDKEFHETYDSYDLYIYVEARFVDSKLTYLAVSKVESGD
jgi:hypothetical protein